MDNRLVMQCAAGYKRRYGDVGYFYNSITRKEQFVDKDAIVFLEGIQRSPKAVKALLSKGRSGHSSAEADDVLDNRMELLNALEADGFILIGETEEELYSKDQKFYRGRKERKRTAARSVRGYIPHQKELFFERFADNPQILRFQMEITSKCNEICTHCYHPSEYFSHKDISTQLALDVLDQLKEEGALTICFSGGEPFLHREFDKLLYRARENDLVVIVLTNGTRITDRHMEVLQDIQPEEVQVSLYSMSPEEHDEITQVKGSHKKTIDGIVRLIEADINVTLSCPVMKVNKDSYRNVLRWANSMGLSLKTDFMLYGCTDQSNSNINNRLNKDDLTTIIEDNLQDDKSYRDRISNDDILVDPNELKDKPLCGAGLDSLSMDTEGNFHFCTVFRSKELGNVHNNSLNDVWNNSKAVLDLRRVKWGDFPGCVKCEAFNYCGMCFARNANENNGDHTTVNTKCCEVSFTTKQLVEDYRRRKGMTSTCNEERSTEKKFSFNVVFNDQIGLT
jgi:radical SAM protein with 4Fe4S-binding SPASM domain